MPRLFTGLEIPPEVIQTLAACRGGLPGARWVEPENYHITLRFIGDVEEGTGREIVSTLGETRRRDPIAIVIDALSSFGGSRPRSVFARVAPSDALSDLQSEQELFLRRVGLAPETRKFTPHVTLARMRDASASAVAEYMAARGAFPKLAFTAHRFALYSARASTGGGPYVVEAAYPLG